MSLFPCPCHFNSTAEHQGESGDRRTTLKMCTSLLWPCTGQNTHAECAGHLWCETLQHLQCCCLFLKLLLVPPALGVFVCAMCAAGSRGWKASSILPSFCGNFVKGLSLWCDYLQHSAHFSLARCLMQLCVEEQKGSLERRQYLQR